MKKMILTAATILSCLLSFAQQPTDMNYTNQDNAKFERTISDPDVQLIDVRTPEEYRSGHIPNAVNMDVQDPGFGQQTAALDKNRPVAVYCRSGMRSKTAADRLAAQGYKVYNLDGGISRWNGKTVR